MDDKLYNSIMDLDEDTLTDIFSDVPEASDEELKAYADFLAKNESPEWAVQILLDDIPF